MEVRDILAKEIMKWTTDETSGKWVTERGLISKSSWHPESDIEDSWHLLEQFEEGLVRKRMNGLNYRAWILRDGNEYSEFGYSPSNAIVSVVLKYLNSQKDKAQFR